MDTGSYVAPPLSPPKGIATRISIRRRGFNYLILLVTGATFFVTAYATLWSYRIVRALFYPQNLRLELHLLEVIVLFLLGADLLVRWVQSRRPAHLGVRVAGRRLKTLRGALAIGRDPGRRGLRVSSSQVSGRHLRLRRMADGGVEALDLGSRNGSYLNGRDLRGQGPVLLDEGDCIQLGLSGPHVQLVRKDRGGLLRGPIRLSSLLAFLWVGLFLGWVANVEVLPQGVTRIGSVGVSFSSFRDLLPVAVVAAGFSALLIGWHVALNRRRVSSNVRMAAAAIQVLLVVGAIVLYPLLPAEGLRYAREAQRAYETVGAESWTSLEEGQAPVSADDKYWFGQGKRWTQFAINLGAQEGARTWQVTYFRQVFGLLLVALAVFVAPLVWAWPRDRAMAVARKLAQPLFTRVATRRHSPDRSRLSSCLRTFRPLMYWDIAAGVAAASLVLVTIRFGTGLGRGKTLFLSVPGIGTVQSVELVKVLFVLFMAGYFARNARVLRTAPRARYLVPFLLATTATLLLTAVQGDMGSLLMLTLFVVTMFVVSGGPPKLFATVPVLLGVGMAGAAYMGKLDKTSIVLTRLQIWLFTTTEPKGEQLVQVRQLFLSSGWFGFPPERALAWRIPDVHGDLVIGALVERYGMLGLIGLAACWFVLVAALIAVSPKKRDVASHLLVGAAALFLIQMLTQVGGAFGLIPFTGVPLPWISHGLTASALFSLLAGLALSLALQQQEGPTVSARYADVSAEGPGRVTLLARGNAVAAVGVLCLAAVWIVWLPSTKDLGPLGRDYRWINVKERDRISAMLALGAFVPAQGGPGVEVDRDVYDGVRASNPDAPSLLQAVRWTDGLRFIGGKFVVLPHMVTNPNWFADRSLPRGRIVDRNGAVLAMTDARGRRLYPLGAAAFHPVGRSAGMVSGLGLETAGGTILNGIRLSPGLSIRAFTNDIHHGADLMLTLDRELQRRAFDLLDGRRGAAVVMDLEDGSLLALASSPAVAPVGLDLPAWRSVASDPDVPLRNRALRSTDVYSPPGSTFKLLMAAAVLASRGVVDPTERIECDGHDEGLGVSCPRRRGHGRVNLGEALAASCNVYFARAAVALGADYIREFAERFGFNAARPTDLASGVDDVSLGIGRSTVASPGSFLSTDSAVARIGFGQGPVSSTPLQLAMVGSVFATGGELVQPRLVEGIALSKTDAEGNREVVWSRIAGTSTRVAILERSIADEVAVYATDVFESPVGTARNLPKLWHSREGWVLADSSPGNDWVRAGVAGKTGSAWKTRGDKTDDAWIVVWAPADRPRVVVTVMLEDAGSGGRVAGPVAMELLRGAFSQLNVQ